MKIRQWLLDAEGRVVRVHESRDNGRTWAMLDPEGVFPMPGQIYARHPAPSATGQSFETVLEKVPEVGIDRPEAVASTQSTSVLSVPPAQHQIALTSRACIGCGLPTPASNPVRMYCATCEREQGDPWLDNPQVQVNVRADSHTQEQMDRVRRLEAMQRIEALVKAGVIPQNAIEKFLEEMGIVPNFKPKKPTKPDDKPQPEKLQRRIRL